MQLSNRRRAAQARPKIWSDGRIREFRNSLLTWFDQARRDLPWRHSNDPYRVWVSEIMLQQTRVTAAIPYYERFLERFPSVEALAEAPEADLLAHWAGLGYYHRARNMQQAARAIRDAGGFPDSFEAILELAGVGAYTAAAIASISFGLPHAVLDGNVFRVLSRVANDSTDIASIAGKKVFSALADKILDPERPGDFNQAMMELGATVCLPKNPQCLVCPVSEVCLARAAGSQSNLPVKKKAQKSVYEERTLYWITRGPDVLLWQRPASAKLMPGFWELPEGEQLPQAGSGVEKGSFRHGITFHDYLFRVVAIPAPLRLGICQWVDQQQLAKLPLSTVARKAREVLERSKAHEAGAGR
ncbi:MAG: A/G-specific adenine glycosylase [Bryobacteraceae bacterium]